MKTRKIFYKLRLTTGKRMIKIWGLTNCAACMYAKQLCQANELEHKFIDVSDRSAYRQMREMFGTVAVPMIVWDGKVINNPKQFEFMINRRVNND